MIFTSDPNVRAGDAYAISAYCCCYDVQPYSTFSLKVWCPIHKHSFYPAKSDHRLQRKIKKHIKKYLAE